MSLADKFLRKKKVLFSHNVLKSGQSPSGDTVAQSPLLGLGGCCESAGQASSQGWGQEGTEAGTVPCRSHPGTAATQSGPCPHASALEAWHPQESPSISQRLGSGLLHRPRAAGGRRAFLCAQTYTRSPLLKVVTR